MNASTCRNRFWAVTSALTVAVTVSTATTFAQTSPVTHVEEDWEVVIGTPSANSDAPQITTLISPLGDVDGLHATFVVNHHDVPSFVAGGLQLQVWDGPTLLVSKRFPNQAVLTQPGETIRWTQIMRLTENGLVFEVVDGRSATWGDFGGEGTLKATVTTSLSHLNGYDPNTSVHESGVSYAGNRVSSLVLKRVRACTASGTVVEDNNPHIVHSLAE